MASRETVPVGTAPHRGTLPEIGCQPTHPPSKQEPTEQAVGRYVMTLQCPHARVRVSIEETDVEDLANNGGTATQIEAAIRAALIGDVCLSG